MKKVVPKAEYLKKISWVCGDIALFAIVGWYFEFVPLMWCANIAVAFGVIHFYTMEIDANFNLGVRPFAYLPFPLAIFALVGLNSAIKI